MSFLASVFKLVCLGLLAVEATFAAGCLRNTNIGSESAHFTTGIFKNLPFSTTQLGLQVDLVSLKSDDDSFTMGYTLTSRTGGPCYVVLEKPGGATAAAAVRAGAREHCGSSDGPFDPTDLKETGYQLFFSCHA